ncbi:hypothetical protein [Butyrivibrio sp. AC2005]|uniref:hypothetical protein n=1 Tax=Butyrivibrio sp. AC2005 TaxID=1280672 RepID=UPI00040D34D6|nr:hypothetical protein [Butyrivibrio sp. AC2005]
MSSQITMRVMLIAIAVCLLFYILLTISIRKKRSLTPIRGSRASMKGIFWLYRFFSQTPVFKRYYQKIRNFLEINYPADEMSIKRKATLTTAKCVGGALLLIIFVISISGGDWFYICMGFFMAYFIFTYFITAAQESLDNKLLNQLGDFITNIRHHYSVLGNVEDAIYDTLDETPYEMGLHASKIYRMLGATNVDHEVDKYKDIAPNKFVLTMVAICATIKEYGDKTLDDGQSLFLTNINYLKEEINVELIKRRRNAFLFSGLITLTLLPLFFLKAIEAWGISNIPEMTSFYNGPAGTTVMACIFVVTVIVYQLIANLKDGHVDDEREHKIISWLLTVPVINRFVTIEINRHYTKHLKIDEGLKMVGDRIGIKGFLVKRILFGLLAIFMINLVIFTAEWRTRHNLLNDFKTTFESSIVPNEEYRQAMRDAAIDYTLSCRKMKDTPENRQQIQAEIEKRGIAPKFSAQVTDEVFYRVERYRDVYYRWWFLLINILGYFAGYYLPYLILQYKLRIVKMDMEDEVIQYQTIVLILMHVDGILVDTVLDWLERFSFCFRQSIQECIINLEYSTKKALQKMKNQETFPPFRRFVDNLLMVEEEDILTAFAEIETDREYYKEKRKTDNEIISTQKAEVGKIVAFIPLILTLVVYMIVPFALYSMEMMKSIGM